MKTEQALRHEDTFAASGRMQTPDPARPQKAAAELRIIRIDEFNPETAVVDHKLTGSGTAG